MNPEDFLLEDDKYKWKILQVLELNKSSTYSLSALLEIVSISRYKLNLLLEEIEQDAELISLSMKIIRENDGKVRTIGINNFSLKKMRLFYLERSERYGVFKEILMKEEKTIEAIASKLFMSRTKAYRELREIKKILKKNDFYIIKMKIVGDELRVRSAIYSFLYECYGGIKSPFTKQLTKDIQKLKTLYKYRKNIFLSGTADLKLKLFIGVSLIRIKTKNNLNNSPLTTLENPPPFFELIKEINLPKKSLNIEYETLTFFCYCQKIIDVEEVRISEEHFKKNVENITNSFILFLEGSLGKIKYLKSKKWFENEVFRINSKWLYFHMLENAFMSPYFPDYFKDIHPHFTSVVQNFLSLDEQKNLMLSFEENITVYYDYLFLLINAVDIKSVEKPIYVCIDFSHGYTYNIYIKESIEGILSGHTNVIFEKKASNKTMLYLSDFVLSKLTCKQIVWKNPPNLNDWRDFIKAIIQIKSDIYTQECLFV